MTGPKRPPERLALADGPIDPALRRSSRESRRYLYFATQPTHRRRIRRRKVRITDSKPTLLSSALSLGELRATRCSRHRAAERVETRLDTGQPERLEPRTPNSRLRRTSLSIGRVTSEPMAPLRDGVPEGALTDGLDGSGSHREREGGEQPAPREQFSERTIAAIPLVVDEDV